jgi:alpha-mannosidase
MGGLLLKKKAKAMHTEFKLIDSDGNDVEFQLVDEKLEPRYTLVNWISKRLIFLADVPACGYSTYYIVRKENSKEFTLETKDFKLSDHEVENEFYKVTVNEKGKIDVFDKDSGILHESTCEFKDVGDWGDEYDFSGPVRKQVDSEFFSKDAHIIEISKFTNGPTQKTLRITMNLKLPVSLTKDRLKREENLVDNQINLYISLYKGVKRIDFKIELKNNSKDHRIQALFPSNLKSEKVYCDGHFYVVPRGVNLPEGNKWCQKPLPTNHQKNFVAVNDNNRCFAVLNKGLPEYEAIRNGDGSITLAITLLRSIEWLSRGKLTSRRGNAGPSLNTPGAQCLGKHVFELSMIMENSKQIWLYSDIHMRGKEFNNSLKPVFPSMINSQFRTCDMILINLRMQFKTEKPNLPVNMSFLEIDNKSILLSVLKKSEEGRDLIARVYNISIVY